MEKMLRLSSIKKQAKDLIYGICKKDIILIVIFPIILFLIMLLPSWIRESLQLDIKNPSWWQYLTQSFVHNGWKHFWGNIVLYFLFSFIGLLLSNLCGEKENFFRSFLFVVLPLPILSSIIQVLAYPSWLPNLQHSQGSSGIISALAGFVPIFWAIYFNKKNEKINFDIKTLLILIIYVVLIFTCTYSSKVPYSLPFLIILLILLVLSWPNFKNILFEIVKEFEENLLKASLLIISFLLFVVTPMITFPSLTRILGDGTFTDFFMHYIGVCYGIIISWSSFIITKMEK